MASSEETLASRWVLVGPSRARLRSSVSTDGVWWSSLPVDRAGVEDVGRELYREYLTIGGRVESVGKFWDARHYRKKWAALFIESLIAEVLVEAVKFSGWLMDSEGAIRVHLVAEAEGNVFEQSGGYTPSLMGWLHGKLVDHHPVGCKVPFPSLMSPFRVNQISRERIFSAGKGFGAFRSKILSTGGVDGTYEIAFFESTKNETLPITRVLTSFEWYLLGLFIGGNEPLEQFISGIVFTVRGEFPNINVHSSNTSMFVSGCEASNEGDFHV